MVLKFDYFILKLVSIISCRTYYLKGILNVKLENEKSSHWHPRYWKKVFL